MSDAGMIAQGRTSRPMYFYAPIWETALSDAIRCAGSGHPTVGKRMGQHDSSGSGSAGTDEAFRAAFDAAPVGMAMALLNAPDRRAITHANQALCDLLGYTPEQLSRMSFADITHPDHLEEDAIGAQEMREGRREVYTTEKRYVRADGSIVWAWLHSRLIHNDPGGDAAVLAHIVDLTERRAAEAEIDRRRRWLEGLADVSGAALRGERSIDILALTCRHAMGLVGASRAFATHVDTAADAARPIAFADRAMREQVPPRLAVAETMRRALNGETFVTGNLLTDPRVDERNRRIVETFDDTRSTIVIGIEPEQGILLHVNAPEIDAFDADDVALVESFAEQAATAVRLRAALDTDIHLAVLEQRESLAGELHNTVIQRVFAAGMGLQSIVPLIADAGAAGRVMEIVDELDTTIGELRAALFRLEMPTADPLRDRLEANVQHISSRLGFDPKLEIRGDTAGVPTDIREVLLDVVAGVLDNVVAHADATEVRVVLDATPPTLRLTVTDNGRGIDARTPAGRGMERIMASTDDVGGSVTWATGPSGGTAVEWTVTIG